MPYFALNELQPQLLRNETQADKGYFDFEKAKLDIKSRIRINMLNTKLIV